MWKIDEKANFSLTNTHNFCSPLGIQKLKCFQHQGGFQGKTFGTLQGHSPQMPIIGSHFHLSYASPHPRCWSPGSTTGYSSFYRPDVPLSPNQSVKKYFSPQTDNDKCVSDDMVPVILQIPTAFSLLSWCIKAFSAVMLHSPNKNWQLNAIKRNIVHLNIQFFIMTSVIWF